MAVNVKDRFAAILSGRGPKLPQMPGTQNAQNILNAEAGRMTAERTAQAVNQTVGQFDARPVTTNGVPQQIARMNAQVPGAVINAPGVSNGQPAKPAQPKLGGGLGAAFSANNQPQQAAPVRSMTLNENMDLLAAFSPGNTEKAVKKAEAQNKAGTGNAVRGRSAVGAYGASNASGGAATTANIAAKLFPTMKR